MNGVVDDDIGDNNLCDLRHDHVGDGVGDVDVDDGVGNDVGGLGNDHVDDGHNVDDHDVEDDVDAPVDDDFDE